VYRIFRIPPGQAAILDALYKDDVVGRQSVTSREARLLGLGGEGTLVLVEGSEVGVKRAEEILKGVGSILSGAEAVTARQAFKAQDEEAASGMGLIFGG
jgi:hypothetical protein